MRLAHLILAYNQPELLARLVKRLITDESDIYIHLDSKTNINEFIHLQDLPNVSFIIPRVSITWGLYSMVEATLIGYQQILHSGKEYSHINLLSGQDYVLTDIHKIQDFLFANADKSFMRYKSIKDEWKESIRRLTKYNLGDYHFPLHYKVQGILNRVMPDRKIPNKMTPFGYSQWMTITPAAAEYVIEYLNKNKAAKRFFKMTFCVDELIFQTILLNSDFKDSIVNNHLRVIKFLPNTYRPRTLTIDDADMLVNSGKFFARKFVIDEDSAILDYLDAAAEKIATS